METGSDKPNVRAWPTSQSGALGAETVGSLEPTELADCEVAGGDRTKSRISKNRKTTNQSVRNSKSEMGTWGPGVYQNDHALDLLWAEVDAQIGNVFALDKGFAPS
jgi:hypothetical protein